MDEKITFLHAADLHLDSPFKGMQNVPEQIFSEIRESTFHAFERLISTAIQKNVDFVLLVGDLFDYKRQSLKAQMHLRKGFEKLERENIAVYLSFGNHDHMNGNVHPIDYPNNVHIFPNEVVTAKAFVKEGRQLANIYGFSYENQAVYENKAKQYKIDQYDVPFHIAMLHGTLNGNKAHNPYATFRLSDLLDEPFDYWALGHIHKREVLHEFPPIVYSGNIQGRHRNELGEKGCYYVELTKSDATLQFIPLQSIIFSEVTLDLRTYESITEIEEALCNLLVKEHGERRLLSVIFTTNKEQLNSLDLSERLPELIELINDSLILKEPWQFIYSHKLEIARVDERRAAFFLDEIDRALEQIDIKQVVKALYEHREAKLHLERLNEEEMIEEVRKLLEQALFR